VTAADATRKGKVGDPFSSPWRRRLPLLPALVFLILVTQLPFVVSIYYSLTDLKDKTQSLIPQPTRFVGLENYRTLLSNQFFRDAMWTSVKMTVLGVLLSLLFGTAFAMLLDRKFIGQGLVRTLLITPFLLMPVVAALIWKQQMFSSLFGLLNKALEFFGLDSVAFISDHPLASIVTVLVWQWTPFMMLIMLAGLQSQPSDILEAANVDGARPFGIFRQLTLPHLRRYLELGALLGSIYIIRLSGVDRRWLPLRLRIRIRHRRRARLDHHRDVRAARAVRLAEGRGARVRGLRTGTTLGVGERRMGQMGLGLLAWVVGLVWIFPVAWTIFTSFKTEQDATAQTLTQGLSLDRYSEVRSSTEGTLSLATAFSNSVVVVLLSTVIVMLLAIPAAYALAIRPVPKWRDVLFFFISTKFLPVVASIFPIYVYAQRWDLLGTRTILVILYTAMNLPLAVWMTRSFFMEVPRELIEAAEIDGTKLINQLRSVILPIAAPGIAATALLCVIFAWNEYFYAIQLNFAGGSTMPQWVIGNVDTRGNFLAKLSAASVIACLPVVVAGWLAQKRMIRGLSMGAIK
jgi:sorbitol/mannitol transport system permease protein